MSKKPVVVAHLHSLGVAPSFFSSVVGHGVAAAVFFFTFPHTHLRDLWLAQFYILLCLSLILTLSSLRMKKQLFRIIMLLNVMAVQIVLGYPEGGDLRVEAILGTTFVVVSMLEITGAMSYVLSFGYAVALSLNQWPISAWGISIPGPPIYATALFAAYLFFLTWLCGLVGNRGHRLRRQEEEIRRLDKTVAALSNANVEFQEWGAMLQRETEEQERKRIAREIHDIVGYTLTNIQMMMEAGTDLVRKDPADLEPLLLKARDQAHRGLLETRRAMRNLRLVPVARQTGLRRIREVVRIFSNATRVHVELHTGNVPASFGQHIDETLYRIVQESLTNSFRHGNATRVSIGLWVAGNILRVTITDDGVGVKEVVPGVGLSGMSERLGPVHGTLTAQSTAFGFRVYVEIPIATGDGCGENTGPSGG